MVQPRAVWHPACKVRFQIRVEDFADDAPVPAALTVAEGGIESFGKGQVTPPGTRTPAAEEFKELGFDIVPYACNIERKSYRDADEIRITIPLSKLPFDPRVIRAATVQIFGGVLDPLQYRDSFDSRKELLLEDAQASGTSNQLFGGFVDDWEIEMGDHNTLQVTARDPTSIFVDSELPENALNDLPKTSSIAVAIRQIISGSESGKHKGLEAAKGIRIVVETSTPLPTFAEIKPPNWFDSNCKVKKGKKRSPNDAQKMSYWDMITDLCTSAGFIVFVRLPNSKNDARARSRGLLPAPEMVITDPRTYYKESTNYGDEKVSTDQVRTFLYGINLDQLKLRRKYGGVKVPTIELRAFDVRNGKRIRGRFPRRVVNNKPAVSGTGESEEVQVYHMREIVGPNAQARLDDAAASIYQQLARGEFEVQLKTKALAALPRNLDPDGVSRRTTTQAQSMDADMFQMDAGQPIIVGVDRALPEADRMSDPTAFEDTLGPARVSQILKVSPSIPNELATNIADAMASPFIQKEFRVSKLTMTWAHDRGWEFEIHALNYLDVRHAVQLEDDDFIPLPDVDEEAAV